MLAVCTFRPRRRIVSVSLSVCGCQSCVCVCVFCFVSSGVDPVYRATGRCGAPGVKFVVREHRGHAEWVGRACVV
jgi:hypothetical protein